MRLLLHIGWGKTGSTSIQKSLYQNRARLLDSGILYPVAGSYTHIRISAIVNVPFRLHVNESPQSSVRQAREIIQNTKRDVAKYRPHTVLLSAENFYGLKEWQIKGIINKLDLPIDEIKVIMYIRNPPELYLSLTQQIIKGDHVFPSPLTWHSHYDLVLEKWAKMVGKKNITVRLFDRKFLHDGDVVHDFVKYLSEVTREDLKQFEWLAADANTSLSAEQMIVLHEFRRDFLAEHSGSFHEKSECLMRFLRSVGKCPEIDHSKPALKAAVYKAISERHEEKIEWLDATFRTNFSEILQGKRREATSSAQPMANEVLDGIKDVSELLETYDKQSVEALKSLLPDYNKTIAGPSFQVSDIVLKSPDGLMGYAQYLYESGLPRQSGRVARLIAETQGLLSGIGKEEQMSLCDLLIRTGEIDGAVACLEAMIEMHDDNGSIKRLLHDILRIRMKLINSYQREKSSGRTESVA